MEPMRRELLLVARKGDFDGVPKSCEGMIRWSKDIEKEKDYHFTGEL